MRVSSAAPWTSSNTERASCSRRPRRTRFVDDDLRNGRLVAPFAFPVAADGSYYFGYPAERPRAERVAAFESCIVREAVRTEEQLGV